MNFDRYIRCAIATVALAATAVLSSCSRDDSQNGAVPAKSRTYPSDSCISLGEPANPSTRSVEYDDGKSTDYENYIDFRNYRVMFFDKSNRYLAAFRPTDIIPLEDNPLRSRLYEAIGKIDWSSDEPFPEDFKVVIMANCTPIRRIRRWGRPLSTIYATARRADTAMSLRSCCLPTMRYRCTA